MKKPAEAGKSQKGKVVCVDTEFGEKYPTITIYLCDGFWDDGKPREPSSISVRMDSAAVHLSISDHALQCSAYTAAPDLEAALCLLEAALKSDLAVWRPWKLGKGK